jgi:hypothetical protein
LKTLTLEQAQRAAAAMTYGDYGHANHVLVPFFQTLSPTDARKVLMQVGRWAEKVGDWPEVEWLRELEAT